jgi:diguanylate cyclase (GGDEF)-like protein
VIVDEVAHPVVDELARRRAIAVGHPSTYDDHLGSEPPVAPDVPPMLEVLAQNRRRAITDLAVAQLVVQSLQQRVSDGDESAAALLSDASARQDIAQDRLDAAADRISAAAFLQQSRRDGLTGALQRDAGRAQLEQELARSRRDGRVLVLAFLDVDGLKAINDDRGHAAGDDALRAVGQALGQCLRSYDVVVRFGGDEFVCALPGLSVEQASGRFEDVTQVLDRLCPGTKVSVGLSVADLRDTVESVLARADADLYALRRSRLVRARPPLDRDGHRQP